jgi:hypothetical protein
MSATALKSTNRRFSSVNYQNFEFFCLVPRSPTPTGLICEKTLKPNISSLGPFNWSFAWQLAGPVHENRQPLTTAQSVRYHKLAPPRVIRVCYQPGQAAWRVGSNVFGWNVFGLDKPQKNSPLPFPTILLTHSCQKRDIFKLCSTSNIHSFPIMK